jgi:sensor c-di-GMP phosphodiesterase-like protein
VTGLKLDRSFTAQLTEGPPAAAILATGIAGLADGLDLMSIAEGVETQHEADILRAQGWRYGQGWKYGQGWLFGRPQAVPALEPLPDVSASTA